MQRCNDTMSTTHGVGGEAAPRHQNPGLSDTQEARPGVVWDWGSIPQ
jgi:hypothetical protein